jgi:hypothetical protein
VTTKLVNSMLVLLLVLSWLVLLAARNFNIPGFYVTNLDLLPFPILILIGLLWAYPHYTPTGAEQF